MFRYLDDLVKANLAYGALVLAPAYVLFRVLLSLGVTLPEPAGLVLFVVLFVAVPVRARFTAREMSSRDVGFLAAHRSTSAEIRAWLALLPFVGHLFGGDRYEPPGDPSS